MRRSRTIWADQGGNTAILFGLAILPILVLAGGAVDFSYRANVRARVQSASDSAALAAARTLQSDEVLDEAKFNKRKKLAKENAEKIFASSLVGFANVSNTKPEVEISKRAVTVSADVEVGTSFLRLIGIENLDAGGFAEVNVPDPLIVEIALVLDYSKSMEENDKYLRMTSAAQSFIAKVAKSGGKKTKLGIVPFSEYVQTGVSGRFIRETSGNQANRLVTACLQNRDYPYSTTVEAPLGAVPGSQWPQADPAGALCKLYTSGGLRMRDLTDDFAGLSEALGAMRPVGYTNIALGAEMGWHMLSPEAPFDTARSRSDKTVRKVMILLTDGVQTVKAMGPSGGPSTLAADETTAELCANAGAAGIRIFTIAYDIEDERVRKLLSGCATSTNGYHEANDESEISAVFDDIYDQIAKSVWLSR